jgi:hypothetical protein
VATGYGILSPRTAAIALIICVLIVAVWVASARPRAWSYRAGVIWALFGVIVANAAASDWLIATICGAGIIMIAVFDRVIPASNGR